MRKTKAPVPGVYKLTNPVGEVYVGSSRSLQRRKQQYQRSLPSAACEDIYKSFIKYGVKGHKFEILEKFPPGTDKQELEILEECYIRMYEEQGIKLLNRTYVQAHLGVTKNIKGRRTYDKVKKYKKQTEVRKINITTGEEVLYPTILNACKELKISAGKLRRYIDRKLIDRGCRYERATPKIKVKRQIDQNKIRQVVMFDYNSKNVLQSFKSISDAARTMNANRFNISQCLIGMLLSTPRNKYFWKYIEDLTKEEREELSKINSIN